MTVARFRKLIAAVCGVAALLVADGTLTGTPAGWAKAALAFATTVGVYAARNEGAN